MKQKQENMQFRILYFIGIFMIVAGHADGGGVSLLYEWFPPYSFHLGLFIFCSGYFFINNKDKNILEFIKKIIKKFLFPLYIWNLIYGIIIAILHHFGIKYGADLSINSILILPIYNGHQFIFNLASWFIWPLFLIEFINIFIIKLLKNDNNYYIYFIFTLLLGFLGVYLAIKGYNKGFFLLLVKVLYFLPFFSLGMLYRVKLEKKDVFNNYLYFGIIFLINLFIIYIFGGVKSYTISWANTYDNFYRPFIVGFLGIAFWLRVSRILVPSFKNSKIVSMVSKNTFSIMLHHLFGFFILNTMFYGLSLIFKSVEGFDYSQYVSNIWYFYLPKSLENFKLLYVIFGIFFSLLIAFIQNKLVHGLKRIQFIKNNN